MAKDKVLTVNDMREVVATNTSILQIVVKQQLDIVNGLNALKAQLDTVEALCQPVMMEVERGADAVDGFVPHVVGDLPVPEDDPSSRGC